MKLELIKIGVNYSWASLYLEDKKTGNNIVVDLKRAINTVEYIDQEDIKKIIKLIK